MSGKAMLRGAGFTLIELMVVVAVVSILAAIALPAYVEQQRKARRADGQAALAGLAIALERYYTEQSPSRYTGASLGSGGIFPNQAPVDSSDKYYNLSAVLATSTFTVSAAPISGSAQAGDKCGTLTLTNLGVRGVSGATSGITWEDCWR